MLSLLHTEGVSVGLGEDVRLGQTLRDSMMKIMDVKEAKGINTDSQCDVNESRI